jgi:hypothetical protein
MTALPKPSKYDRKRTRIDTTDLVLPKSHFDRDANYRAWIREHRCLLHWFSRCNGPVEAAHLQRGGLAEKGSDYSCIPLCGLNHHRLLDGNSLDHEIEKFLWQKAWFLLNEWRRREER